MSLANSEVIRGLRDVLGEEAFVKLLKYSGNSYLWIPTYENYYLEERNEKFREMYRQGWPVKRIADHFGVHHSTVYYVIGNYQKTRRKREENKNENSS